MFTSLCAHHHSPPARKELKPPDFNAGNALPPSNPPALQDDLPPQDLYVAFSRPLLGRCSLLPPSLRSRGVLQPGLSDALVGPVVVAALALHRAPELLGFLEQGQAARCVAMFEAVALQLIRLLGGTMVSGLDSRAGAMDAREREALP